MNCQTQDFIQLFIISLTKSIQYQRGSQWCRKMIDGLIKTPLKQFKDDRGKVMHMLRSTDPHFKKFGEIYFSWINPEAVKAWNKHTLATLNYAVPVGSIQLILYDDRPQSPTYKDINEYILNTDDYYLLTIPPHIFYGFQSLNNEPAMIVNCSTLQHDPKESIRLPIDTPDIPYKW